MKIVESLLNSWPRWAPWLSFSTARHAIHRELGCSRDERLLIINIDDAGLCHSHNEAIAQALERGAATSCSVMTMTPGFEEFVGMAREHRRWSVGIHLVLTSEWPRLHWGPVAGSRAVPSLVTREGHFHPRLIDALVRGRAAEVRREWRAQITRALDAGLEVDHLDCHMGPYHFRPGFFSIARDLAREFGLALMVVAPWHRWLSRRVGVPCGDWPVIVLHRSGGRRLWRTVEDRRRQLLQRFTALRPGVSFFWTHISEDDEEWRSIRPPHEDLEQEDYPGEHRDQYEERITDYRLLSDPTFREEIEALGIRLISYAPLRKLAQDRAREARGEPTRIG
jgi:hypothetical protein